MPPHISAGDLRELKDKVKKKKGRGFETSSSREDQFGNNYDRVRHVVDTDDEDQEEDNFPQRCKYIDVVTSF